jgi:hypothetical protein
MYRIRDYLASQGIHGVIHIMKANYRPNYRRNYTLEITEFKSTVKFLRKIRPFSIIKKQQIELYFNNLLPLLIKRKKHPYRTGSRRPKYNHREFLKAMVIVDRINSLKGGTRGKYNANYFRRLFGFKQKRKQPGYKK